MCSIDNNNKSYYKFWEKIELVFIKRISSNLWNGLNEYKIIINYQQLPFSASSVVCDYI